MACSCSTSCARRPCPIDWIRSLIRRIGRSEAAATCRGDVARRLPPAPGKESGALVASANPYSCSTPPEAYSRPDRRTPEPARAAAVKDGRHAITAARLAAWRPLLDGREHTGPIGRIGAPAGPATLSRYQPAIVVVLDQAHPPAPEGSAKRPTSTPRTNPTARLCR